ncbi:butyrate kinase [Staphylococcus carnosus]|uniref:butyrate kinase n=1 Tax=Staphylococcus carnosus TaxID=1281 RepID=UPI0006AB87AA|nr:butyrate kinase [Staphylococcus carnosus]KOR13590.1 butyrate kinase [Staphylococcus carnosus]
MAQILVINLGSTSSKIAVFNNQICIAEELLQHDISITQLSLLEQESYRVKSIEAFLSGNNISLKTLSAIACRGGLLKPIVGGTYYINQNMYNDLRSFKYGVHASNLSGIIGFKLSQKLKIPSFVVDPVVVDELIDIARVTGIKDIQRKSVFHALNQKPVAREYAMSIKRNYNQVNVIVAHMGGGITVGAHNNGKVIDVNDGLLGEGPLSPERAGSLPNDTLYKWAHHQQLLPNQLNNILSKESGLIALCGSNDLKQLIQEYNENQKIRLAIDAMIYQTAKLIGERAVTLKGSIDQIILTGGIAKSDFITKKIDEYVNWIAPITVYPGEKEMESLAIRVDDVINKKEQAKIYS